MLRSLVTLAVLLCLAPSALAQSPCPWQEVQTLVMQPTAVIVNGRRHEVAGVDARRRFQRTLEHCGMDRSAETFRRWRAHRRTSNYALPLVYGSISVATAIAASDLRHKLAQTMRLEGELLGGRADRAIASLDLVDVPDGEQARRPDQGPSGEIAVSEELATERLRVVRAATHLGNTVDEIVDLQHDVAEAAAWVPGYDEPPSLLQEAQDMARIVEACGRATRGTELTPLQEAAVRCESALQQARPLLDVAKEHHLAATMAEKRERIRRFTVARHRRTATNGRALVVAGAGTAFVGAFATAAFAQQTAACEVRDGCSLRNDHYVSGLPGLTVTALGLGMAGSGALMVSRGVDGSTKLSINGSF